MRRFYPDERDLFVPRTDEKGQLLSVEELIHLFHFIWDSEYESPSVIQNACLDELKRFRTEVDSELAD